ncbi:hypothetical protein [Actinomadura napierensis]|uniref:hypothetical protein n=1 Tax=Actinomadura napierensis TaxID=267854 RepID=UPI0031CE2FCE
MGADGYPVVAPVEVTATTRDGIVLAAPGSFMAPAGRRAGLTGHGFTAGTTTGPPPSSMTTTRNSG